MERPNCHDAAYVSTEVSEGMITKCSLRLLVLSSFDEVMARRGLWQSSMAGGVANIWGYLHGPSFSPWASRSYPHPHWTKTSAEFLRGRFLPDLQRDAAAGNGMCLRDPQHTRYLVYRESAHSIRLDLSAMPASQQAMAVDTTQPYREIPLGTLAASDQVWQAPYQSD